MKAGYSDAKKYISKNMALNLLNEFTGSLCDKVESSLKFKAGSWIITSINNKEHKIFTLNLACNSMSIFTMDINSKEYSTKNYHLRKPTTKIIDAQLEDSKYL